VRNRDEEAAVTAVLRMVAVVGGNRGAPDLFWGLSIVGLPRHLGVRCMRRMVLGRGSGRSGHGLDVLFGPRTAKESNEAAFDGGIFIVADER